MGTSSKKADLVGIHEVLEVGLAVPPKRKGGVRGAQCIGVKPLWEGISKQTVIGAVFERQLTDAAPMELHARANRLARSRGRNTRPGPETHRPLTPFGPRTAQGAFQHGFS